MSADARIRILSVDDHAMFREGIAAIIASQADMQLVAEASTGSDGVVKFREHRPDVTLMDLRLPDMSGMDAMTTIRSEFPCARFIVLTTSEGDAEISRALSAGAYSYILKSMSSRQLVETIRLVHAGQRHVPKEVAIQVAEHLGDEPLTDREVEVLRLLGGGNRNHDIAEKLFISEHTVKVHLKHIMEKLGAMDRTEALAIAVRRGIVHL